MIASLIEVGNWGIRDVCAEKVAKFVPAIAILPAENEKVIRPILEVLKNDLVVILIGADLALHVLFSSFTSTERFRRADRSSLSGRQSLCAESSQEP